MYTKESSESPSFANGKALQGDRIESISTGAVQENLACPNVLHKKRSCCELKKAINSLTDGLSNIKPVKEKQHQAICQGIDSHVQKINHSLASFHL